MSMVRHVTIHAMTTSIERQVAAHAEGLFKALQDERIFTFLDDEPPRSIDVVRERILRLLEGAPKTSGETWLNWTVFEDGSVVGYTQATIEANGNTSLAYVLTPSVWGQSVAYAACIQTLSILDELPEVLKVVADTEVGNVRSQTLLKRLGFRQAETIGQDVFFEK